MRFLSTKKLIKTNLGGSMETILMLVASNPRHSKLKIASYVSLTEMDLSQFYCKASLIFRW